MSILNGQSVRTFFLNLRPAAPAVEPAAPEPELDEHQQPEPEPPPEPSCIGPSIGGGFQWLSTHSMVAAKDGRGLVCTSCGVVWPSPARF
jgi:hypothetical protein